MTRLRIGVWFPSLPVPSPRHTPSGRARFRSASLLTPADSPPFSRRSVAVPGDVAAAHPAQPLAAGQAGHRRAHGGDGQSNRHRFFLRCRWQEEAVGGFRSGGRLAGLVCPTASLHHFLEAPSNTTLARTDGPRFPPPFPVCSTVQGQPISRGEHDAAPGTHPKPTGPQPFQGADRAAASHGGPPAGHGARVAVLRRPGRRARFPGQCWLGHASLGMGRDLASQGEVRWIHPPARATCIPVCPPTAPQSLYPSMIIAYNLCYSTCIGKVAHAKADPAQPLKFGVTEFALPPGAPRAWPAPGVWPALRPSGDGSCRGVSLSSQQQNWGPPSSDEPHPAPQTCGWIRACGWET